MPPLLQDGAACSTRAASDLLHPVSRKVGVMAHCLLASSNGVCSLPVSRGVPRWETDRCLHTRHAHAPHHTLATGASEPCARQRRLGRFKRNKPTRIGEVLYAWSRTSLGCSGVVPGTTMIALYTIITQLKATLEGRDGEGMSGRGQAGKGRRVPCAAALRQHHAVYGLPYGRKEVTT